VLPGEEDGTPGTRWMTEIGDSFWMYSAARQPGRSLSVFNGLEPIEGPSSATEFGDLNFLSCLQKRECLSTSILSITSRGMMKSLEDSAAGCFTWEQVVQKTVQICDHL